MERQNLVNNYQGKILAIESYGNNKSVYIDDFTDSNKLLRRLHQIDSHELSLTDDGLAFIKEYYGIDNVLDLIMTEIDKGADFKYQSREDIEKWLENKVI